MPLIEEEKRQLKRESDAMHYLKKEENMRKSSRKKMADREAKNCKQDHLKKQEISCQEST
jgi:hypothetical protein